MTFVVTGAAGFIGSHTVDQLLYRGHHVIGIDDFSTGTRRNLARAHRSANFTFHQRSVLEPDYLVRLCRRSRPDALLHLADPSPVAGNRPDRLTGHEQQVAATRIAAEAARQAEVSRLVFASSAAVYGSNAVLPFREDALPEPTSPAGTAKLMSELLLREYGHSHGMTIICNRYFNVFGPRQDPSSPHGGVVSRFIDHYARNRPVTLFGDGRQTRDFISVHDVSYANALAALTPDLESGAYNICTGRAHSLRDLVALLQKDHRHTAAPHFATPRAGEITHSVGCPEKAAEKLGFRAHLDFEAAVHELSNAIHSELIHSV